MPQTKQTSTLRTIIPRKTINVIIGAIAATAGILFGYDTGVISGVILFVQAQFHLTPLTNGLVVGTVPFGALFGAIISGRLANRLGRRNLLMITAIIFFVGTLGCTLAPSTLWLIASRFIVGLAIGTSSYTAPLYISEVAPLQLRGILVSLNQLAVTIGIVCAYLVNYIFSSQAAWRHMFAVGLIPAIILFIGMLFLPFSPRWLVIRHKTDEARKTLLKIRGSQRLANAELAQIMATDTKQGNIRLLLQSWIKPALLIAISLAILQQITGINTIIYYAPTIFTLAGFKSAGAAILATLGIGIINVLFTIIALPLIDRWGRRPLLLSGTGLMVASLFVLSYAFHIHHGTNTLHILALISMMAYIVGFAVGLGPITWLMIVEIFPLQIRGLGSSLATACNWGSNMVVGLTFLTLIHWLSPAGTFLLFAIISAITCVFMYYIIPETKGISLETIEHNLQMGKSARHLGQ